MRDHAGTLTRHLGTIELKSPPKNGTKRFEPQNAASRAIHIWFGPLRSCSQSLHRLKYYVTQQKNRSTMLGTQPPWLIRTSAISGRISNIKILSSADLCLVFSFVLYISRVDFHRHVNLYFNGGSALRLAESQTFSMSGSPFPAP